MISAQNRTMALIAEPFWHQYLKTSQSSAPLDQLSDRQTLQSMEENLSSVVSYQPDNAAANLRLAALHLRMFDCESDENTMAMDVRQIRDAALASHFQSRAELDLWLSRAFGSRRSHLDAALRCALRALTSCPLKGEAYVYLAELSFLDGPAAPQKAAVSIKR